MQWKNEPSDWSEDGDRIVMDIDEATDAWRHTKHDFVQDNAPWYYRTVDGDFITTVRFSGAYEDLYDQAGLMLREDDTTWCKCGIELLNNQQHASAVITREFSDWSVVPITDAPDWMWIQIERTGGTIEVSFSRDGTEWTMFRQGTLTDVESLSVGVMGAAPQGDGFRAIFEDFSVEDTSPE